MRRGHLVQGYDYVRREPVARTTQEWDAFIADVEGHGGYAVRERRSQGKEKIWRPEMGDTRICLNGRIIAEIHDGD